MSLFSVTDVTFPGHVIIDVVYLELKVWEPLLAVFMLTSAFVEVVANFACNASFMKVID